MYACVEGSRERAISGGSQSKNSEHIFSSLESGSGLIGPHGIFVFDRPSFSPRPFHPFSILFSVSSTCSPRSLRSKRADAGSSVRGVSCEKGDGEFSGWKGEERGRERVVGTVLSLISSSRAAGGVSGNHGCTD